MAALRRAKRLYCSLYDKALYAVAFVLGVTYLLSFVHLPLVLYIPLKAVTVNS